MTALKLFLDHVSGLIDLREAYKITGRASRLFPEFRGALIDEAKNINAPLEDVILANYAYELNGFGCSVKVERHNGELRMLRNLDWDLPGLEKYFEYEEWDNGFKTYSLPGLVGPLQGSGPEWCFAVNYGQMGEYEMDYTGQPLCSITNWMVNHLDLNIHKIAMYLCANFKAAHRMFITLASDKSAMVIELIPHGKNRIRYMERSGLVQTNHAVYDESEHDDTGDDDFFNDSVDRYEVLVEGGSLCDVADDTTVLSVEMSPGDIHLV